MGANFAIPHLFFILILEFYVLYVTKTNVSPFLLPYFVIFKLVILTYNSQSI